jgi:hypothetical protein
VGALVAGGSATTLAGVFGNSVVILVLGLVVVGLALGAVLFRYSRRQPDGC